VHRGPIVEKVINNTTIPHHYAVVLLNGVYAKNQKMMMLYSYYRHKFGAQSFARLMACSGSTKFKGAPRILATNTSARGADCISWFSSLGTTSTGCRWWKSHGSLYRDNKNDCSRTFQIKLVPMVITMHNFANTA